MSGVLETRKVTINGILIIRRTRKCGHCEKQFHTKEIVDQEVEVFRPKKQSKKKPTKGIPLSPPPKKDPPVNPFISDS